MPKKRFDYKSYPDRRTGETVYEATVPVRVQIGNIGIPLNFLVDSGAQRVFMRSDIAPGFGIDLLSYPEEMVEGIGGQRPGRVVQNVEISIKGLRHKIVAPVTFVDDLDIDGILGQRDFFKNFHVYFEQSRDCFYLEDVPAPPLEPPDEDLEG